MFGFRFIEQLCSELIQQQSKIIFSIALQGFTQTLELWTFGFVFHIGQYLQVGDGGGGGQGGGVCHLEDRGAPHDQAVTAQAAWKDGSERPQGGGYDWVASIRMVWKKLVCLVWHGARLLVRGGGGLPSASVVVQGL
eukprot:GFUD01006904.1.p1 GENE.GFUD01006904.1~~GFUD01006904.1.p1  ORF type:complete len:137 (+),score=37.03 GFUD01006904.1:476-886(+)